MKEVFQVIDAMKREGVIEDYAVAGAVGAIFYTEPFLTMEVDRLDKFLSSEDFDLDLFEDIVKRFSLEKKLERMQEFLR